MKVIVANYRYFVAGGPEKYMFKFIDAAQKRGIEVIPFSVSNSQNKPCMYERFFAKPRADELMYADIRRTIKNYWVILRATLWNYDAEHKLRKLIRATKPDAVYILHEVNHLSPSIIRAAKKENIRVVHRISDFFMFCAKYDFLCGEDICEACIHGDYTKALVNRCVKNSRMGTLLRITAMKIYDKIKVFDDVDSYVVTCNFTKNKLIEGGVSESKIRCIPTFINSENIIPCYEHDKYFLFLGRMARQKGIKYAVEAMKYLKDTDYVLKVTGKITEDEEDQRIWKYVVDNGLEDKVIFTDFLYGEELSNLIRRAACIICPSIWYENMPNTVIEAYSYGKPVVASNIGSLAEIVDDNVTGRLFDMKNSYNLSKVLKEFVDDESLSERLGRNAREKCEVEYSESKHMDMLVDVLFGGD